MRYAILVGINDYTKATSLRYCHADVDLLQKTLVEEADFAQQNVRALKLGPKDNRTPAQLLEELETFLAEAQSGDTVVFYFSGHGALINDEAYLFLPDSDKQDPDRTALPLRSVTERLRKNNLYCFRILDACHSGAYARGAGNDARLDTEGFMQRVADEAASGWVTYAACTPNEVSWELDQLKQGLFTSQFCEAIRSFNPGQEIRYEALNMKIVDLVAAKAAQLGRQQTPMMHGSMPGKAYFAQRRPPPQPPSAPAPKPPTQLPIKARLEALEKNTQTNRQERQRRLRELQNQVTEALQARKDKITAFDRPITIQADRLADSLPSALKGQIVRHIESEGLQALHTVRSRQGGSALMPWLSLYKGTEYEISQTTTLPPSLSSFTVVGGELVSGASGYAYICPLQTRELIFTGVTFEEDNQSTAESWVAPLASRNNVHEIETQINRLIQRFNERFTKATEQRLNYLDRENAL